MDYRTRVVLPFVKKLIRENYKFTPDGFQLNVDDLDDQDLREFAMYLLEYDDRDLHSIYENDKYDNIISTLIKMLKKDDTDNKLDFAEMVRDKIVDYYKPKMQELINDYIGFVEEDYFYEHGATKNFKRDNDSYWFYG